MTRDELPETVFVIVGEDGGYLSEGEVVDSIVCFSQRTDADTRFSQEPGASRVGDYPLKLRNPQYFTLDGVAFMSPTENHTPLNK